MYAVTLEEMVIWAQLAAWMLNNERDKAKEVLADATHAPVVVDALLLDENVAILNRRCGEFSTNALELIAREQVRAAMAEKPPEDRLH